VPRHLLWTNQTRYNALLTALGEVQLADTARILRCIACGSLFNLQESGANTKKGSRKISLPAET
jgi:hypothetical protein